MARPLARDDAGINDWIVLLALVLAAVVVVGAYYVVITPGPITTPPKAALGDTVYIDYVGYFPNDNLVFDTSVQAVAYDNATYPKAYSFAYRSSYTPLQFTIGTGAVVEGFDEGVRGLSVGQTTTISVPPSLGYGAANPALVYMYDLNQTIPVRITMNTTAFTSIYGQPAISNTNVTDPVYGWPATTSVLNGVVTVTNSPYPGEKVRAYGAWDVTVLSIDDAANNGTGTILIENHLDPSMVDRLGAKAPNGAVFYLSAVDLTGGTYTLNFNKQVVGRTLMFRVTLTKLSSNV